jgi:hypothetical protein
MVIKAGMTGHDMTMMINVPVWLLSKRGDQAI